MGAAWRQALQLGLAAQWAPATLVKCPQVESDRSLRDPKVLLPDRLDNTGLAGPAGQFITKQLPVNQSDHRILHSSFFILLITRSRIILPSQEKMPMNLIYLIDSWDEMQQVTISSSSL